MNAIACLAEWGLGGGGSFVFFPKVSGSFATFHN